MSKLTYTEDQIEKAFDEPINGVKRFFNEVDAIRGEDQVEPFIDTVRKDNEARRKKEEKEIKEPKEEKEPKEPKDKEPKEEKPEKDEDTTMPTKVRKVVNDLQSKKDGYDFISMTDLSVGQKFKAEDYAAIISLIADKKMLVARFDKSGKEDPEGPDNVPGDEIVFWLKGR